MRQWRLIYDLPTDGPRNMAVDEAILTAVAAREIGPTLRLYAWHPACLSLGYGQSAADVSTDAVEALGFSLVRRPTGGRAILHVDELTYSVTLPLDHPLAEGDVIASYRRISQVLMAALRTLGLRAESARRASVSTAAGPVCFETPSHYEITVGGRKLIGSAQLRRQGALLQHGSLPLMGDVGRICDVLAYPDSASRDLARLRVHERAITLSDALARSVAWEEAASSIAAAFISVAGADFDGVPSALTEAERALAEGPLLDRYASREWTFRR